MMRRVLTVLVLGLVLIPVAWAQQLATVEGTVLDPNGDPLPGVQVTIATRTAITDEEGRFTVDVVPGDHELVASLQGFTLVRRNVTVTASGLTVDVTMMAAVRETVTVTGSFIPGQVLEE